MKYALGIMDLSGHSTWEEALENGAIQAWIFDRKEMAHAAIQGALLASNCLTGDTRSLRFKINGKELDPQAIKKIELSIGHER